MLNNKFEMLTYLIFNLLSLYTINVAIGIFFNRNQGKTLLYRVMPYLLYLAIGLVTYLWHQAPLVNTVIYIGLLMIVQIPFENSFQKQLTFAVSWTLFKIVLELAFSHIYVWFLGIDIVTMLNDDTLKIIGNAYIVILTLIIVKLVQLIAKHIKKSEKVSYLDSFIITIIPICSIAVLYAFIDLSLNHRVNNWKIVVSIMLMVFINVFFFYLFDKLKDAEQMKYENAFLKQQSEYYIHLEEKLNVSYDRVRCIKHDLKHQLLYLKMKINENTITSLQEIEAMLEGLIGEISLDDFIEYTKNKTLNHLINYKLFELKQDDIEFEIKVKVGENVSFDVSSMFLILGNAIDNAVENFVPICGLDKKITIRVIEDNHNIYVKISNPYAHKLYFKNGLPMTHKSDQINHGMGLKSIKKLVGDRNGYFNIRTDNHVFTLEVLLYDES